MKTAAPSPAGTNRANLFLDGKAARAVAHGRALLGAAYDSRFGIARDQYEPPKDDVSARLGDLMEYLKGCMEPSAYTKAELMISDAMQLSKQRIADHHAEVNEANSSGSEATDDDDTAQGAYPPKVGGNLSMDSRSWAKPDTAQANSRKRLLGHLKRIGQV